METSNVVVRGLDDRLRAAERTIAVLKRRILSLQDGGGQSVIDRQIEVSRRRIEEHERRRALMEMRAAELEGHKARLESEVAARTRAIRTILNNVQFGFFLVDRAGVVDTDATKSCESLFRQPVVGARLVDVLRCDATLSAHVTLALEQVFEDVMPEEVSLGLLPSEVTIGGCVLSLSGRLVRDAVGAPTQVLFSVADVTALHESRREAELNRTLVQILSQRGAFRSFVCDAQDLLGDAQRAAELGDQATLRRIVHTLKGNAASFGLSDVVDVAHDVEGEDTIDRDGLARIDVALRGFFERHGAVLDMRYDDSDDDVVVLSGDVKDRFFAVAESPAAPAEVRALAEELRLRPASEVLTPLHSLVERLAERLGKQVVLRVEGLQTRVDTKRYGAVIASLGHLIRNAVDHGIEPACERGDKGATGHIDVVVEGSAGAWSIQVRDDGRGLDRAAIAARARELCVYCKESEPTDDELLALIAADGLTTAEVATEISGRGVGVAAVLGAVRAVDGRIELTSTPGHGTTFTLTLPR